MDAEAADRLKEAEKRLVIQRGDDADEEEPEGEAVE